MSQAAAPAGPYSDFEAPSYGAWGTTGTALGPGSTTGTLPEQQPVTGFEGSRLVNSYVGGDAATGTQSYRLTAVLEPSGATEVGLDLLAGNEYATKLRYDVRSGVCAWTEPARA
ncbi:hypothetical protein [Amycolatopsis sp. cmx-11-12]|uniref:hypothetical protein n=1 Tax=Amycolatopsis sp. cmx-11-12 TaxID=2785795 RepID=UPI003917E76A